MIPNLQFQILAWFHNVNCKKHNEWIREQYLYYVGQIGYNTILSGDLRTLETDKQKNIVVYM